MLRRYEDKVARPVNRGNAVPLAERPVPRRAATGAHAPSPRHGIDGLYVCDGAHDRSAPCHYRPATDAERAEFRHARLEVK